MGYLLELLGGEEVALLLEPWIDQFEGMLREEYAGGIDVGEDFFPGIQFWLVGRGCKNGMSGKERLVRLPFGENFPERGAAFQAEACKGSGESQF